MFVVDVGVYVCVWDVYFGVVGVLGSGVVIGKWFRWCISLIIFVYDVIF